MARLWPHAAARAKRQALLLLEAPDLETRLRSAIERCGCLLDDLDRVLEAVAVGESQAPPAPEYARFFRALREITGELQEDRKRGVDTLYRAGLGVLGARAETEGERDPLAILAREVGAGGGRLHRAA